MATWEGPVVIVTGSRIWHAIAVIHRALAFHAPVLVVTGACPSGADVIAENWAKKHQVDYIGMPARWDTPNGYDKTAGYRRNVRMLEAWSGALVLGFPEGEARGTKHCLAAAEKRGHPVVVYDHTGAIVHRTGPRRD